VVVKQEAFDNHKREIKHTTGCVNRHRKDINEISVDMRLVLKCLDRLEKKVWEQKDTIDTELTLSRSLVGQGEER